MLNLVPIFFHLICLPLWYIKGSWIGANGNLSLFEYIINLIIVPIYLVILNANLFDFKLKNVIVHYIHMAIITIAGAYMHFFNWWISDVWIDGKRLGMIDSMTIELTKANAYISFYLLTFLWIIVNVIRLIIFKRKKEA